MSDRAESHRRHPWLVRMMLAVVALLLVAIGVAVGLFAQGVHPAEGTSFPVGKPVIVWEQQLKSYGSENQTVYWAGPQAHRQYELTRSTTGASFIRYLPEGVKAGSEHEYLTVATYPQAHGYELLTESVNAHTTTSQKTESGALVVADSKAPQSTYFSFPDANFQVEVFSPTQGQSLRQVLDGEIVILGAK